MATLSSYILKLVLLAIPLFIFRLRVILNPKRRRPARRNRRAPHGSTHLLVVLGSGGHTAEMIAMLERAVNEKDSQRKLDWTDYSRRTWVIGTGDSISAQRANDFEKTAIRQSIETVETNELETHTTGKAAIITVPRARAIHQSVFTAPITSLRCMLACLIVLLNVQGDDGFPDVILCNGPATATILVLTSILLRFFNVRGCETSGKMRTIYVESWARVKKLSLSGRLLSKVVDRFLVQWPQLEKKYGGRLEYLGVLV